MEMIPKISHLSMAALFASVTSVIRAAPTEGVQGIHLTREAVFWGGIFSKRNRSLLAYNVFLEICLEPKLQMIPCS